MYFQSSNSMILFCTYEGLVTNMIQFNANQGLFDISNRYIVYLHEYGNVLYVLSLPIMPR